MMLALMTIKDILQADYLCYTYYALAALSKTHSSECLYTKDYK